jgi:hypothetical protein
MLGGISQAIGAEKLMRYDLNEISDDRTLNRAYELFGGRPRVEIEAANEIIPADLKKRLTEMTALKPEEYSSGGCRMSG